MSIYTDYTNPYQPNNTSAAPTTSSYTQAQDDTSIFAKFKYNQNDSMSAASLQGIKGNVSTLLQRFPNLRDNVLGMQDIYFQQSKNPSITNDFNLPNFVKNAFLSNGTVGVYTPNTHQLIFQIPQVNGQDRPDKAFKYFAHELGHSIDYQDYNRNGTVADDVSFNNYGSFSTSSQFHEALKKDFGSINWNNLERSYPELAKELKYPLSHRDPVDQHRESFAVLASHILTGEDRNSGIAQVMPNAYALAKQQCQTA